MKRNLPSVRHIAGATLLIGLSCVTVPLHCEPIALDFSQHEIAIDSSFTGAQVLLFGAIEGRRDGDIMIVLRGPNYPTVVRRKARTAGIWLNRSEVVFVVAPGYYAIGASSPVDEILDTRQREVNQIGLNNIKLMSEGAVARGGSSAQYQSALLRHKVEQGLYFDEPIPIEFIGANLFRARFNFPSTVPPGAYKATVHHIEDGEVVATGTTSLRIRKIGLEARIYQTAHDSPWLYGILAVVLALMAGWLASAIFRRS